jgi:protein gp37
MMYEKNGDEALAEYGAGLANQTDTNIWNWAQWAYDCAPIGEDRSNNGSTARITTMREHVIDHPLRGGCGDDHVPSVKTLLNYREAADAVLPEHRGYVPVKAGRVLKEAGAAEREQIIGTLLDEGVPITAKAVRQMLYEMRAAQDDEQEEWSWEDIADLDRDELADLIDEYELGIQVDNYGDNELRHLIADAFEIPEDERDEPEVNAKRRKRRKKRKKAKAKKVVETYTIEQWKQLSTQKQKALLELDGQTTFNEQTNTHIGWAQWSWNPITGCNHGCQYCYARSIAHRFYIDDNEDPDPFVPMLRPNRLTAPLNTPVPDDDDPGSRRVFAGSMTDIFGKWVPTEWIEAILAQMAATPQFEYLMLTKFPQRLAKFEWPDNVWAGTTVDTQARVKNAQRSFENVTAGIRWLSCEPLLGPVEFESLEMFDWVVIGSCTANQQPDGYYKEQAANIESVMSLTWQAQQAGCKVYQKDNLLGKSSPSSPGMKLIQEWPR